MQPTQILSEEHQSILRVLTCLEALVHKPEHAEESRETFVAIVDFLRTYADRLHHGKEEVLLFPAMEAQGMNPEQGPTAAMRHEHEIGRALVQRMAQLVSDAEGEFPREEFAEPALEFVGMLRAHIGKEDLILFPMADRSMNGPMATQLAVAFERVEAEQFEPNVHEHYESWARELAQRLGVDQDRFEVRVACHG